MNLYFLKYFYDAVRLKSVSQAAQENHVTKSAISQGIVQVEKWLQVPLLTHQRNKIKTTPQGDILHESCRAIFQQIEELQFSLKSSQDEYRGSLTLACSHSIGLTLLPDVLNQFRKIAPKVSVQVLFGHTGNVKQWLQLSQVEVGLVLDNDDLSRFILEPIYKGKFAIFESIHRNPDEPITSCIFAPARVEVFAAKQAFLQQYGYELKTDMEICSWEVIASLISSNQGVGLIPDYYLLHPERSTQIRQSSVDVAIPFTIHIASVEPLSKNAKLFAAILQEHIYPNNLKN